MRRLISPRSEMKTPPEFGGVSYFVASWFFHLLVMSTEARVVSQSMCMVQPLPDFA